MPQHRFLSAGLVLCLALFTAAVLQAEQADPPTKHYVVKRCASPVTVDGVINEAAWKACEPIQLGASREGGTVSQKTVARMMWDERFFYLAFECEDANIWSTMTVRDQPIYNEEVVEAFINDDGDRETYLELEVNPLNTLWDGFILNRGQSRKAMLAWNSLDLKRAVSVDGTLNNSADRDRGWNVEIALPLADVSTGAHTPARAGDRWRVNLYRIDLPKGAGQPGEHFAWSPVGARSFHAPDQFGEIEFSDEILK